MRIYFYDVKFAPLSGKKWFSWGKFCDNRKTDETFEIELISTCVDCWIKFKCYVLVIELGGALRELSRMNISIVRIFKVLVELTGDDCQSM